MTIHAIAQPARPVRTRPRPLTQSAQRALRALQPEPPTRLEKWFAGGGGEAHLTAKLRLFGELYKQERARLQVTGKALHQAYGRLVREYEAEFDRVPYLYSLIIDRLWAGLLPPFQYALVRFIYDRTLGWEKISEGVTLRHFTRGYRVAGDQPPSPAVLSGGEWNTGPARDCYQLDRRGIPHFAGLNMSKDAAMNQLGKLIDQGVIYRAEWGVRGDPRHAYRLRLDWAAVLVAGHVWSGPQMDTALRRFIVNAIARGEVGHLDLLELGTCAARALTRSPASPTS